MWADLGQNIILSRQLHSAENSALGGIVLSPQQAILSAAEKMTVSSKAESRWQAITCVQHAVNNNLACTVLHACKFEQFSCNPVRTTVLALLGGYGGQGMGCCSLINMTVHVKRGQVHAGQNSCKVLKMKRPLILYAV